MPYGGTLKAISETADPLGFHTFRFFILTENDQIKTASSNPCEHSCLVDFKEEWADDWNMSISKINVVTTEACQIQWLKAHAKP